MPSNDDRELDSCHVRDGSGPESRRVDDDWRRDAFARGRLDAGCARAGRTDRYDLDALLDANAASSRRLGVPGRHRGRIAVAGIGLVEDGAEMIGVDPWLEPRELARLQHLGANAESTLELDSLFELYTHRGANADNKATDDVDQLAPTDL